MRPLRCQVAVRLAGYEMCANITYTALSIPINFIPDIFLSGSIEAGCKYPSLLEDYEQDEDVMNVWHDKTRNIFSPISKVVLQLKLTTN
jgi:hypothetical protein